MAVVPNLYIKMGTCWAQWKEYTRNLRDYQKTNTLSNRSKKRAVPKIKYKTLLNPEDTPEMINIREEIK